MLTISDACNEAEENVYKEFVRKLCNIRIEEYFSSTRQKVASQKGNAAMKEQNLRDKLLTHHTNLRSRVKF
jgi:type III secretory pathway component EscR